MNHNQPNTQDILRFIRSRREELGYSQEYMAFKLAISQNAYCKIENGNCRLTIDTLLAIGQVLQVSWLQMP
jgi:transcriptional regulator with XRE-family HTH domain